MNITLLDNLIKYFNGSTIKSFLVVYVVYALLNLITFAIEVFLFGSKAETSIADIILLTLFFISGTYVVVKCQKFKKDLKDGK